MTKTKSQFRAEAVENIRKSDGHGIHVLLKDVFGWDRKSRHSDLEWKEALINLLTDECDQPCYTCSRLAELVNENGQLRAEVVRCAEKNAEWERKYNKAMGEEYEMRKSLVNERDELKAKLESCGQYSDQREQPETTADESYDTREEPYIVVDGEKKWVEADSREKLEADVRQWFDSDIASVVFKWLDRQAAITKRELCGHCKMLDECVAAECRTLAELQAKNDKLREKVKHQAEQLAEVQDALHKRNEEIKPKWEKVLKKARKDNAELQAKVAELKAENADARHTINKLRARYGSGPTTLTDEQIKAGREVYGSKAEYDMLVVDELADSREKLEADVRGMVAYRTSTLMFPPSANKITEMLPSISVDTVLGWLDRQAALTHAVDMEYLDDVARQLDRANAEKVELQAKVDELERDRDEQRRRKASAEQNANSLVNYSYESNKSKDELIETLKESRDEWKGKWEKAYEIFNGRFCDEETREAKSQCKRLKNMLDNMTGARDMWKSRYEKLAMHVPYIAVDGHPIEIGQIMLGGDGQEWEVEGFDSANGAYPVVGVHRSIEGKVTRGLKPKWLTHKACEVG